MKLREQDLKQYLDAFKKWANSRVERLKKEGWKKAQKA
jgi:hypothetical protein